MQEHWYEAYDSEFPLILLQAKAGGGNLHHINGVQLVVSISSPSGEGGGLHLFLNEELADYLESFH